MLNYQQVIPSITAKEAAAIAKAGDDGANFVKDGSSDFLSLDPYTVPATCGSPDRPLHEFNWRKYDIASNSGTALVFVCVPSLTADAAHEVAQQVRLWIHCSPQLSMIRILAVIVMPSGYMNVNRSKSSWRAYCKNRSAHGPSPMALGH